MAMVEEFMGSERFDKFMLTMLAAGNLRMKPRHRTILENAKFVGVTALGVFFDFDADEWCNCWGVNLSCACAALVPGQSEISFRHC